MCVYARCLPACLAGEAAPLAVQPGRRLSPGPGSAPRGPALENSAPRAGEGHAGRLRAGGAPGWRRGNLTCMMEVKKDENQAAVLDKGEEDECLVELQFVGTMF